MAQVTHLDQRKDEARQSLGELAHHLHIVTGLQAECADYQGGRHHCDENARGSLEPLEQQDNHQAAGAHDEGVPVGLAIEHRLEQGQRIAQGAGAFDGNAKQLWCLAYQHRQRDAVHVAVANRLGQQFGDEPESQQAGTYADQARDQCHGAGQDDCALRVAAGQRQHDRENDGNQRRIRPEHQETTGAEQRVGQQRNDGGVQAIDTRNTRCLGVGNADRHQHGGKYKAGDQVPWQPAGLVSVQHLQARQPAPPSRRGWSGGARRPSRFGGFAWWGVVHWACLPRVGLIPENEVSRVER
ncbi:hypothetical protein FQZ97_728010 [compost metagenome]